MSNPNLDETKSAAEAFTRSYGAAISLTQQPNYSATEIAAALVRHYSPNFTAYDHGYTISPSNDPEFWLKGVTMHLERFQKAGLGWKMELQSSRVEVTSADAAKCHLTWAIEPESTSGVEGWSWTNVYGWRDGEVDDRDGLRGAFVDVISDEETEGLMKNVPGFMEL